MTRVHYPGLESNPGHALARRQMGGYYGGVVSFEVSSVDAARSFLERLRIFTLAESLGAVESLAESPAIMTHASIPRGHPQARRRQRRADTPLGWY